LTPGVQTIDIRWPQPEVLSGHYAFHLRRASMAKSIGDVRNVSSVTWVLVHESGAA
jgi:hypothetical protein